MSTPLSELFLKQTEIIEKKRAVARRYDALFADCPAIATFPRDYDQIVPFIYPVRVASEARDGLVKHFAANGVHADLRYSPCHWEPFFGGKNKELPETDRAAAEVICLPIFADMAFDEIDEVVSLAREFINR